MTTSFSQILCQKFSEVLNKNLGELAHHLSVELDVEYDRVFDAINKFQSVSQKSGKSGKPAPQKPTTTKIVVKPTVAVSKQPAKATPAPASVKESMEMIPSPKASAKHQKPKITPATSVTVPKPAPVKTIDIVAKCEEAKTKVTLDETGNPDGKSYCYCVNINRIISKNKTMECKYAFFSEPALAGVVGSDELNNALEALGCTDEPDVKSATLPRGRPPKTEIPVTVQKKVTEKPETATVKPRKNASKKPVPKNLEETQEDNDRDLPEVPRQKLHLSKNVFGNFEHKETGIIFHPELKKPFGIQRDDGKVDKLDQKHKDICLANKWGFVEMDQDEVDESFTKIDEGAEVDELDALLDNVKGLEGDEVDPDAPTQPWDGEEGQETVEM